MKEQRTLDINDEALAWHFLPYDRRLRKPLPDGSRPIVTPGWTYRANTPQALMHRRLDAFERVYDAICASVGYICCRVRLRGAITRTQRTNRLYATEFTVLWMGDAAHLLRSYMCDVAERILLRERLAGREPPAIQWMALTMKRQWLAGEIEKNRAHLYGRWPFRTIDEEIRAIAGDPPPPGPAWREWQQTQQAAYRATPHGAAMVAAALATVPSGAVFRERRTSYEVKSALAYAPEAARVQSAAWSPEDEAAAAEAGLVVDAEQLNAELERLLTCAFAPRGST